MRANLRRDFLLDSARETKFIEHLFMSYLGVESADLGDLEEVCVRACVLVASPPNPTLSHLVPRPVPLSPSAGKGERHHHALARASRRGSRTPSQSGGASAEVHEAPASGGTQEERRPSRGAYTQVCTSFCPACTLHEHTCASTTPSTTPSSLLSGFRLRRTCPPALLAAQLTTTTTSGSGQRRSRRRQRSSWPISSSARSMVRVPPYSHIATTT